jgi:hypothetical protein
MCAAPTGQFSGSGINSQPGSALEIGRVNTNKFDRFDSEVYVWLKTSELFKAWPSSAGFGNLDLAMRGGRWSPGCRAVLDPAAICI